jgi:hypothetical protein
MKASAVIRHYGNNSLDVHIALELACTKAGSLAQVVPRRNIHGCDQVLALLAHPLGLLGLDQLSIAWRTPYPQTLAEFDHDEEDGRCSHADHGRRDETVLVTKVGDPGRDSATELAFLASGFSSACSATYP